MLRGSSTTEVKPKITPARTITAKPPRKDVTKVAEIATDLSQKTPSDTPKENQENISEAINNDKEVKSPLPENVQVIEAEDLSTKSTRTTEPTENDPQSIEIVNTTTDIEKMEAEPPPVVQRDESVIKEVVHEDVHEEIKSDAV